MKLGIVGHAAEKFTPATETAAKGIIEDAFALYEPEVIISGQSPMGGVDVWAEEMALAAGIGTQIYAPDVHKWDGPGGFKERNLQIATESDAILVVVVEDYFDGYEGMRFKYCYHCKGRLPEHRKSGGCWTAWQCQGKREWAIIAEAPDGHVSWQLVSP